ncbi:MAG: tetratricopeptide repeat protein [Acidobacteria bacterium]|nr:tetratricopeptide repeat protein [Acidobacteriota bacterium]
MNPQPTYQFGRFHLDATERVLLADGKAVALSPKLFDTLLALVAHAGRIVEKEELLRTIWPDTFVEENSLNKNVHALRRLLGETESFIETIPKRGYRFMAEVSEVGTSQATMLAQRTRTSIVIEEEIDDEPQVVRMAVLPFRTLGDSDGEHLGVGLADALITRLGNLSLIHVRPTAAIVKYDAPPADLLAAARELQVDAVLDGSIRRVADRIRVTVQLISARHEAPLWAEKFDERFTDIFAVEDAISERVADALLLKLTGDQRRLLTKRYTENIAAYELYLRGIHQLNQYTAPALQQATVFFSEAVKHDPSYALAHARLGGCYVLIYVYRNGAPSASLAQLAQAAAERALSFDDSLAEAQATDAQVKLFCQWNKADALAASQRAVALKPHSIFANFALGWSLAAQGRVNEGVTALRQAQQTEPHSPGINVALGHLLAFAQRYDEAAACYQQALALAPQHSEALRGLGLVNLLRGRVEDTLQSLNDATNETAVRHHRSLLRALACARTGDSAGARQALAEANAQSEHIRSINVATIYATLGETDEAFVWLERACAEREPMLVTLGVYPFLDSLHDDPRFHELLRRI